MPITDNLSIEYTIPDNIKEYIDIEFCKQFMKELHIVWGFSLEDFDYDSITYCEGTSGWYESFTSACRKLKKDNLFVYYVKLPWYDSDLFDAELTQILVDNKLLLPESEADEIARQNNLDLDNICICNNCGKYYLKEDAEYDESDEDLVESLYTCKKCKTGAPVANLTYDIKKSIMDILLLNNKDYFVCSKCHKIHSINHKGQKYCLYCETPKIKNGNTNEYYYNNIKINEKYHDSLIPIHYEYNGYQTDMIYSYEDDVWYGCVKPIKDTENFKDLISFHSETRKNTEAEFHSAVDDYIEFCKEVGKL